MRKTDVPIPPLVIAMLLAPGLENALRQSLVFSDNDLSIFVTRPISAGIFALLITSLAVYGFRTYRSRAASNQRKGVQL